MKLPIAIAAGLLATACATTVQSENVVLVPAADGAQLIETCSRPGPEGVDSFFEVSPREVTAVESAIMRLLREKAEEYRELQGVQAIFAPFEWPDNPASYTRAYVGYIVDGERMVYGDFRPASTLSTKGDRWATLCDGGSKFFGVEYSLDQMKVKRIAFDGSRGGLMFPAIEP